MTQKHVPAMPVQYTLQVRTDDPLVAAIVRGYLWTAAREIAKYTRHIALFSDDFFNGHKDLRAADSLKITTFMGETG